MPAEPYEIAPNGFINLIQEMRGGLLEEELDAGLGRSTLHSQSKTCLNMKMHYLCWMR